MVLDFRKSEPGQVVSRAQQDHRLCHVGHPRLGLLDPLGQAESPAGRLPARRLRLRRQPLEQLGPVEIGEIARGILIRRRLGSHLKTKISWKNESYRPDNSRSSPMRLEEEIFALTGRASSAGVCCVRRAPGPPGGSGVSRPGRAARARGGSESCGRGRRRPPPARLYCHGLLPREPGPQTCNSTRPCLQHLRPAPPAMASSITPVTSAARGSPTSAGDPSRPSCTRWFGRISRPCTPPSKPASAAPHAAFCAPRPRGVPRLRPLAARFPPPQMHGLSCTSHGRLLLQRPRLLPCLRRPSHVPIHPQLARPRLARDPSSPMGPHGGFRAAHLAVVPSAGHGRRRQDLRRLRARLVSPPHPATGRPGRPRWCGRGAAKNLLRSQSSPARHLPGRRLCARLARPAGFSRSAQAIDHRGR
jgi:hypothetical protein